MPYQVKQIIEGKGMPVCVVKDDPVSKALALMIEHDFSQLPVIIKEDNLDIPEGMITYESILRGLQNFKAEINELKVRDVMIAAPTYSIEDDLFDILDRLKDTNAVLIMETYAPDLVGIVTSYDTTEYFRNRTEDLMRVEDIELNIKEFIREAYISKKDDLDEEKLNRAITQITANKNINIKNETPQAFDNLNLGDYINLLVLKETWSFFEPVFVMQRGNVNELLQGVRVIRNDLAHFHGDISPEQRDKLKFGFEWLNKRQEEYHARKEKQEREKLIAAAKQGLLVEIKNSPSESATDSVSVKESSTDFSVTGSVSGGGRYAPLADWLQSQPGRVDQVSLTFNQIEDIINSDLPVSARSHRAWWANDPMGHTQSQLWLDAGWRTTSTNLSEGKITFSRIREREKAYIAFFSKLLDELRKMANFPVREASPDGASWIIIQSIPRGGGSYGDFTYSFSRDRRLRVELYLDLGDQIQTKAVFDKLLNQKDQLEAQLGEIDWERLDNRRGSRIALYHEGYISEDKGHTDLRRWAVVTMVKFFNSLAEPAEKAILEVKNG